MRTSWIAPLGAGFAVTVMIAGCSWFGGGEQSTAQRHLAPVTTDPHAGTITPAMANARTPENQRGAGGPTNQQVREAQEKLKDLGLYQGRVDGLYGRHTIAAVDKFQSDNKLPRTGELNGATEQRLQTAQANQRQNRPQTAQQPAPSNSPNPQTSAVPPSQNPAGQNPPAQTSNSPPVTGNSPNASPSANAPNNQPSH